MNKTSNLTSYVGYLFLAIFSTVTVLLWYQQRQTDILLRKLTAVPIEEAESTDKIVATPKAVIDASNPAAKSTSWIALPNQLKDSVVQVFTQAAEFNWLEPYKTPNHGEMYGSAFFINEEGELITNAHVVDQAKSISIQVPSLGKRRLDVQIVAVAPERDLALLKLEPNELEYVKKTLGKISYLNFGNADKVSRGDKVMTLGYPLGQQFLKSTKGVVSGRQHLQTIIGQQYLIQIDAPINPGNSGGPSINNVGEVIGVNSMGTINAQNVGYIIPSNEVQLFIKQARLQNTSTDGHIKFLRKPFLGLYFNTASSEDLTEFLGNPQPGGLYVVDVYKQSPLAKIGIKGGDMIYSINGLAVDIYGELNAPWSEDKLSLMDYTSRLTLGDTVNLVYYRKGKRHNASFKFEQTELLPVRRYYPGYEAIDYQVIGGLTIMQFTVNHIPLLLPSAPELTRYMDIKNQQESALVITNIFPDSQAARQHTLTPGTIIKEINNVEVKTFDDLRKALYKSLDNGFLTIRTMYNVFAVLPMRKVLEDEKRLSRNYFYPLNDTVRSLIEQMELKSAISDDKKTS